MHGREEAKGQFEFVRMYPFLKGYSSKLHLEELQQKKSINECTDLCQVQNDTDVRDSRDLV